MGSNIEIPNPESHGDDSPDVTGYSNNNMQVGGTYSHRNDVKNCVFYY